MWPALNLGKHFLQSGLISHGPLHFKPALSPARTNVTGEGQVSSCWPNTSGFVGGVLFYDKSKGKVADSVTLKMFGWRSQGSWLCQIHSNAIYVPAKKILLSSKIITSTDWQVKMHQAAWMWPTVRLRKITNDLSLSNAQRHKKKMKLGWIFPQQPQQGQKMSVPRGTLIFFFFFFKYFWARICCSYQAQSW